jgi:2-phospho-L-lactate/phosphoenolpyruvate guanylyltransferase
VLPVKGGPLAKSRLGARPELAAAIALDCLDAVLSCAAVSRCVVVSADAPTRAAARAAGARAVGESRPGAGLVAAVADGLTAVRAPPHWCGGPTAVLLADLPALRAADLESALQAVEDALATEPAPLMCVVPDADGSGTVLLAAATPGALDPAFGPGSLAEHTRRGALRLDLDLPRLRRDVDTPADLEAALTLGVGPRTAAAVRDLTA